MCKDGITASSKVQAKQLLEQTEKKHGNRVIGNLRRLERKQFSVSCLPSFFKAAISFLAAVNITVTMQHADLDLAISRRYLTSGYVTVAVCAA
jgi:hypothetical protein